MLILRVLAEVEPISIGDLAELTGHHVASLGQMLERMEEAGWIERQRDAEDRRKVVIRSTERGRELLRDAPPFGPWRLSKLAENLSEPQLEELSSGFEWLSNLFSPPVDKEDPMHCHTRGFGKRVHIEFGPGGPNWDTDIGARVGEILGGLGFGFKRRFRSRRERLEKLETYQAELKAELEAVEEEIREIKNAPNEPTEA